MWRRTLALLVRECSQADLPSLMHLRESHAFESYLTLTRLPVMDLTPTAPSGVKSKLASVAKLKVGVGLEVESS